MTTEDIYKLTVVANDEKVTKLKDEVEKADADLRKAIQTLGTTDAAVLKLDATVQKHVATLGQLQRELKAAEGGFTLSGQKGIQFGRILDDLQYVPQQGLRPIINNIMELAPAIGVAMIAVQALISSWGTLAQAFGFANTKSEAERMEELGKKTEKTAEETAKLLKYERERSALKSQTEGQTKAERERQGRVEEAVIGAGQDELAKDLISSNYADVEDDPAVKTALAHATGLGSAENRNQQQKNLREARLKAAKASLARAQADPAKMADLVAHMEANSLTFGEKQVNAFKRSVLEAPYTDEEEGAFDADQAGHADYKARKKEARDEEKAAAKRGADRKKELDDVDAWVAKTEADAAKLDAATQKTAVTEAKESGVGDALREQFEFVMRNGGSLDMKSLRSDLSNSFGGDVADKLLGDAQSDAQRSMVREALGGKDDKVSKSQTIGGEDLASRIQAGVSNQGDKELRQLEKITKTLDSILSATKAKQASPAVWQ